MHSLNKNLEKLEELLTQFNEMLDIIAISETKLLPQIHLFFMVFHGFSWFLKSLFHV